MPPPQRHAKTSITVRVSGSGRPAVASNIFRRAGLCVAAILAVFVGGTRATQDAIANGDTRTLSFYHNNTRETLTVTFRRNGQYDPQALEQLNWFLRDWRREEKTRMDPRLFDTVWEVYREVGSEAPVRVNSAYRSPNTNAMLRRRSSAVAKNSQHMLGKALDFYLPDVPTERLRAIGMRLQNGGVGYYPNAYTPFVHLDVGSVRAWPRMTRDQLARIFPDGKTVHVPSDGTPFSRYEEARAEVLAKGGTVGGYSAVADADEVVPTRRKSFWATLFGGADEDEDAEEIRANSRPGRNLLAGGGRNASPQEYYASDSNSSVYAALAQSRSPAPSRQLTRAAVIPQPRVEEPPAPAVVAAVAPALREDIKSPAPLPPTRIAGLPQTVETSTGPSLSWQQGPGGLETSGGRDVAFAPMPPRRPDDVSITSGPVIAYAPIPPARPSALAQSNPIPVPGVPELRGLTSVVASLEAVPPPLPPVRPVAAITVASAAPLDMPITGSTAPARPAAREEIAKPVVPAKVAEATKVKAPMTGTRALMTAGPSLAMGFSQTPMGDLATNRFTGPAVKPLPVIR